MVASCSGGTPAPVNTLAASDSVKQLVAITTAMAAMDGMSGLRSSNQLLTDGAEIFSASFETTAVPQGASISASCSPTSCTFGAGMVSWGSFYRFSGSATLDGSQLTLDIQASSGHTSASSETWTITGTLSTSGPKIDGTLRVSRDNTLDYMAPGTTTETIEYQHVAIDGGGCPVGGSILVDATLSSTSDGSRRAEDIEGTAVFGPACGDVR